MYIDVTIKTHIGKVVAIYINNTRVFGCKPSPIAVDFNCKIPLSVIVKALNLDKVWELASKTCITGMAWDKFLAQCGETT